jgi:DNA-binding response OmpR family regulator
MTDSKRNALIIEDDEKQAEIYMQALTMEGFVVEVLADGALAQASLPLQTPQLILLDLHLPRVSGEELLEQIQDAAHLQDTKIVIVTANPEKAALLNDKSDLVLIKPISFQQLRDLVRRLFS